MAHLAVRQRVQPAKIYGEVDVWNSKFGWIKPATPISHPEIQKHKGKVYVAAKDIVGKPIFKGAKVEFFMYKDANGLGAELCRVVGGVAATSQQPAPKVAVATSPAVSSSSPKPPGFKAPAPKWAAKPGSATSSAGGAKAPGAQVPQKVPLKPHPPQFAPKGAVKGGSDADKIEKKDKFGRPMVTGSGKGGIIPGKSGVATGKGGVVSGKGPAPTVTPTGAKPVIKTITKQGVTFKQVQTAASPAFKGSVAAVSKPAQASATAVSKPQSGGQASTDGRERIHNLRLKGTVTKWFGKFGWIQPTDSIDHPLANRHRGEIHVKAEDTFPGQVLKKDAFVDFLVYADKAGLGADKVRICPKPGAPSGAPAAAAAALQKKTVLPTNSSSSSTSVGKVAPTNASSSTGSWGKNSSGVFGKGHTKGETKGKGQLSTDNAAKAAASQQGGVKQPGFFKDGKNGTKGGASSGKGLAVEKPSQLVKGTPAPKAGAKGQAQQQQWKGAAKGGTKGSVVASSGNLQVKKTIIKPGPSNNAPQAKVGKPLPPNWEEHISEEHNVPYFWNRVTKESAWLRPTK